MNRASSYSRSNSLSQRIWKIVEGDTFPSFEDERDAVPPLVLDKKSDCCECRTSTVFGDSVVV